MFELIPKDCKCDLTAKLMDNFPHPL